MTKQKNKVFIDANVFIAATLSPIGGSFRLITEAQQRSFKLFSAKYPVAEAVRNISLKYPEFLIDLKNLFVLSSIKIIPEPTEKFIQKATLLIDAKDVPILACSMQNKMDFLLTLDKEHFYNPKIKSAKLPFEILSPGDFIKKYF